MVTDNSSLSEDMQQLGHQARQAAQQVGLISEDAVPGDPAAAEAVAQRLRQIGHGLGEVAGALHRLVPSDWRGQAAEACADHLRQTARRWQTAADMLGDAGQAMQRYADALATHQPRGQAAQDRIDQADSVSESAWLHHQTQAAAYSFQAGMANLGAAAPGVADPGPWKDPAQAARQTAQAELADARAAVQHAGDAAASTLEQLASRAPVSSPPSTASTVAAVAEQAGSQLLAGAGDAVVSAASTAKGVYQLQQYVNSPLQLWMQDPETARSMGPQIAATASAAWRQPWHTTKAALGVNEWRQQPAHALGNAVTLGGIGKAAGAAAHGTASAERAAAGIEHTPPPAAMPRWADTESTVRTGTPDWGQPPPARPQPSAPDPVPATTDRLDHSASPPAQPHPEHGEPPGRLADGPANSDHAAPPPMHHTGPEPPSPAPDMPPHRPEGTPHPPLPREMAREELARTESNLAEARRNWHTAYEKGDDPAMAEIDRQIGFMEKRKREARDYLNNGIGL